MKKTLSELLYELLEPVLNDTDYEPRGIGNKCVLKLDSDRRIEIYFSDTFAVDHYNALTMKLTHKVNGLVNATSGYFKDVLKTTAPNGVGKHIWKDGNAYKWAGQPDEHDFNILRREIDDYIKTWR